MKRTLDLIEKLLDKLGMDYLRMDGQTPTNERQELINNFSEDPSISIFLLSTRLVYVCM